MGDFLERFNERYFTRLERRQEVVEQAVMLRHPRTGCLHRPVTLETAHGCDECGAGFSGISVSVAVCSVNLPDGFEVVNLVDDPKPVGVKCKRCFR